MKFIAILRDPVERAYSHWNFYHEDPNSKNRAQYYDSRSFEDAVLQEMNGNLNGVQDYGLYLYKGKYVAHLENWYHYYPEEQILLLDFEELKNDPKVVLKKVTKFLKIPFIYDNFELTNAKLKGDKYTEDKESKAQIKHYNTTPYKEKMSREVEEKLVDF